jgi:hypothetical protein
MPEVVVGGPLLRVLQDLVSLVQLFETDLGLRVAGIAVGVELFGEPPIGVLELLLARPPGKPERFIVVALGHVQRGSFGLVHDATTLSWEIAMFSARGKGEPLSGICGACRVWPQPGVAEHRA